MTSTHLSCVNQLFVPPPARHPTRVPFRGLLHDVASLGSPLASETTFEHSGLWVTSLSLYVVGINTLKQRLIPRYRFHVWGYDPDVNAHHLGLFIAARAAFNSGLTELDGVQSGVI